MLRKRCTANAVVPIALVHNNLNYIMCSEKIPDVVQCGESGVLYTLSVIRTWVMFSNHTMAKRVMLLEKTLFPSNLISALRKNVIPCISFTFNL